MTPTPRGEKRIVKVYAAALVGLAVLLNVALLAADIPLSTHGAAWHIAPFVLLAILVERQSVRLTRSIEISVAFLPLLFVGVVFGPLASGLVGAATLLPALRPPYVRWTIWTASRCLVGGFAGLAAYASLGIDTGDAFAQVLLATAVAASTNFSLELLFGAATVVVRRSGTAREIVREAAAVATAGVPFYTIVVAFIAYAYLTFSPWSAALFFIPAIAAQRLFVLYQRERDAVETLAEVNRQLEGANLSFATALVATLDARDRYTAGHSAAVAIYARDTAGRLGLGPVEQRLAYVSGLVHDIGKIGLPPGLLEKAGPLTDDERARMQDHSEIGERILAHVQTYAEIAAIVRHHHERCDGAGYPDGLRRTEIPLLARIISVADAYNAMTSDRPYRKALAPDVARERLESGAGSQFDPAVVAAFDAILAEASDAYRLGKQRDFLFEVPRVGVLTRGATPARAVSR